VAQRLKEIYFCSLAFGSLLFLIGSRVDTKRSTALFPSGFDSTKQSTIVAAVGVGFCESLFWLQPIKAKVLLFYYCVKGEINN
jgi:hypothetical protein